MLRKFEDEDWNLAPHGLWWAGTQAAVLAPPFGAPRTHTRNFDCRWVEYARFKYKYAYRYKIYV